jgi:hypothetical protein
LRTQTLRGFRCRRIENHRWHSLIREGVAVPSTQSFRQSLLGRQTFSSIVDAERESAAKLRILVVVRVAATMARAAGILFRLIFTAGTHRLIAFLLSALGPFRACARLATSLIRRGFCACLFLRLRFEATRFAFVHNEAIERLMCQRKIIAAARWRRRGADGKVQTAGVRFAPSGRFIQSELFFFSRKKIFPPVVEFVILFSPSMRSSAAAPTFCQLVEPSDSPRARPAHC